MRALSVVWKIYDDRLPGYTNDTNGLIVVRDLCEHIGKKIDSYLLLGKEYLPEMILGNIHIVDSERTAKKSIDSSHLNIMKDVFEKALIDIQPDIVHIHDCGDFCRMCMNICLKKNIPFVFTAHGFIEKNQTIAKKYEADIYMQRQVYTTPNINIVAVGKGIANKIILEYPNLKEKQMRIIQNGTDFNGEIIQSDLKEKLGLQRKKVLICPGKITSRKNQIQIVRAFSLLQKSTRESLGVIFCGNDRLNGELEKTIQEFGLGKILKYVGALSSARMKEFYSISDGLITASISEGLSIAALEALSYGVPLIMFADVECATDLCDEQVVCLAKQRTDQELANTIENWANKKWNRNYILKYSRYFSMDRVADEYIDYYSDILKLV